VSVEPYPHSSVLPLPCLALITDRHQAGGRPLEELVVQAAEGGVDLVQVREKDLPPDELYELTCRIDRVLYPRTTLIFVNDRVDVVLAAAVDGVHLPERSVPPWPMTEMAQHVLTGKSIHGLAGITSPYSTGAHYLQFGTVFPSRSKPGREAAGLAALAEVCCAANRPVLAVGGIDASNAGAAIRAGAAGVAVISAIMAASDPKAAAAALRRAIDDAWLPLHGPKVPYPWGDQRRR